MRYRPLRLLVLQRYLHRGSALPQEQIGLRR
jgi:hypothetical protein